MFNFNKLNVLRPNEVRFSSDEKDYYSFVGIRPYQGKMTFFLPKGFDDFDKSYENVKNLFFKMYRTFEKFRQNGEKYGNKFLDDSQKENTKNKNGQGAYIFTDEDNNETVLYSKIDLIDKIFQTYQELEIESLIQELGLVEEVDYSKVENYLDKGIFLNNNAIFIENMIGYRNIVRGVPSDLIELFCYIYKELANELEQEVSEQIKEIAFNFSYKYLSPEQSLFSEHSFESTISILKDCLDNIHKTTAYKNYQYLDIYESVEHFLYGSLEFDKDSNQGFWGINNFSYIWEEMCNYVILQDENKNILYCDSNLPLNEYKNNLTPRKRYKGRFWIDENTLENNFNFTFHSFQRNMYPDIIYSVSNPNKVMQNEKTFEFEFDLEFEIKIARKSVQQSGQNDKIWASIHQKGCNDEIFKKLYSYFLDISKLSENSKNKRKFTVNMISNTSIYIQQISNKYFKELINDFKIIYCKVHNSPKNKTQKSDIAYYIIDWKYYFFSIFDNPLYRKNNTVNQSIIKQLAYEFCLSQQIGNSITNQFGLPYYVENDTNTIVQEIIELDCGIEIVRLNFKAIQEIYLNG